MRKIETLRNKLERDQKEADEATNDNVKAYYQIQVHSDKWKIEAEEKRVKKTKTHRIDHFNKGDSGKTLKNEKGGLGDIRKRQHSRIRAREPPF